ncbi:NAD-dependent dehydratase [Alcaligenes parafaecalis]|uniref:NAD-dependent dehydratase n=1 Tax=Alcaligenes parafaecalis TaxID=171260 RepID=A0ABT3VMC2_9BURK|nr:NAD-dependent dehydratase [Alcaligenes parafaecalis]MCX5464661.1 NAD-dependent dehydratase [Alcaligenes parafaecalis]
MNGIKTGTLDWTGDNPFIYLKTDPDLDWSSLSLYFRIASSEYGSGQAILVLDKPYEEGEESDARWLITDNEALAEYLVRDFVRHFGLFRKAVALDKLKVLGDGVFQTVNRFPELVTESVSSASAGLEIALQWHQMTQPAICVDLPQSQTQTQKHEMMCVFHPAQQARVLINGTALPGSTIERDFNGTRAQSASLANSETWVRVA